MPNPWVVPCTNSPCSLRSRPFADPEQPRPHPDSLCPNGPLHCFPGGASTITAATAAADSTAPAAMAALAVRGPCTPRQGHRGQPEHHRHHRCAPCRRTRRKKATRGTHHGAPFYILHVGQRDRRYLVVLRRRQQRQERSRRSRRARGQPPQPPEGFPIPISVELLPGGRTAPRGRPHDLVGGLEGPRSRSNFARRRRHRPKRRHTPQRGCG